MPRACCTPATYSNKDKIFEDLQKHYQRGVEAALKGDEQEKKKDREKYYSEAIKHYERAIDKCDRAGFKYLPLHYDFGNVQRKRKDYHAALGAYHRAVEESGADDNIYRVRFAMGLTCKLMADDIGNEEKQLQEKCDLYTQAANWYTQAIAANSEFKEAYNNLGIVQVEIDKVLEHMELLAGTANQGNRTYLRQAVSSYDKALAKDPKYQTAIWNRAVALDRLGDYEEQDDATKHEVAMILSAGNPTSKPKSRLCGAPRCIIS